MRIFTKRNAKYGEPDYYPELDPSLQGWLRRYRRNIKLFRQSLSRICTDHEIGPLRAWLRFLATRPKNHWQLMRPFPG